MYNGIIIIKKNEIVPYAEMWMDQETIRVKQVRKRKTNALTHIGGIWKNGTDELICKNRNTDTENKHMDTKGERQVGWIRRWGLAYIHCYV